MKSISIAIVATTALIAGCVPSSQTGQDYSRNEARKVQQVQIGQVLDMQTVNIEGTKSGAGTVAGGALGGVAGSAVGGGKGKDIATVVGAIAGAAVGAAAEESMTRQQAIEYTIRLENGKVISVVQASAENEIPIRIGDSVKLLSQGSTYRVTALPNPAVMQQ
ncbi:glycine zipper 2TM domain-containing protein [Echinimonas agarilytica]|uniref:Glycine zipper 2TM domain-containing protein n=1 Tax=Echinimonas agarilytica TaxID=1215918 RepID=A0AA42B798_9GAMM|nr:glycine zipper 2TM domain-containing protein [Echinimonas agarilytica]MCM2679659.1 glycine zipper 2TM domain-containing protein [Echinimonas agarilytica]